MESSFKAKNVSRLNRADFTIRSNIVRNLPKVKGLDRETIGELWKEYVLARIINLYHKIFSACSELYSDEGQDEKAYGDREDCSSQT